MHVFTHHCARVHAPPCTCVPTPPCTYSPTTLYVCSHTTVHVFTHHLVHVFTHHACVFMISVHMFTYHHARVFTHHRACVFTYIHVTQACTRVHSFWISCTWALGFLGAHAEDKRGPLGRDTERGPTDATQTQMSSQTDRGLAMLVEETAVTLGIRKASWQMDEAVFLLRARFH